MASESGVRREREVLHDKVCLKRVPITMGRCKLN
jgi:hypothetical protein